MLSIPKTQSSSDSKKVEAKQKVESRKRAIRIGSLIVVFCLCVIAISLAVTGKWPPNRKSNRNGGDSESVNNSIEESDGPDPAGNPLVTGSGDESVISASISGSEKSTGADESETESDENEGSDPTSPALDPHSAPAGAESDENEGSGEPSSAVELRSAPAVPKQKRNLLKRFADSTRDLGNQIANSPRKLAKWTANSALILRKWVGDGNISKRIQSLMGIVQLLQLLRFIINQLLWLIGSQTAKKYLDSMLSAATDKVSGAIRDAIKYPELVTMATVVQVALVSEIVRPFVAPGPKEENPDHSNPRQPSLRQWLRSLRQWFTDRFKRIDYRQVFVWTMIYHAHTSEWDPWQQLALQIFAPMVFEKLLESFRSPGAPDATQDAVSVSDQSDQSFHSPDGSTRQ